MELLGDDDDRGRQQSELTTDSGDEVSTLFESLLLSASLLLRYSSHLLAVHSVLRSRPASSSRPSPNRSLDLSDAPSRSARAITFTSPQPPSAAGKKGTAQQQLSPVAESVDEEADSSRSTTDGMYGAMSCSTQCLLLVAASAVLHPRLGRPSVALATIALQCINKSAAGHDRSRRRPSTTVSHAVELAETEQSSAREVLTRTIRCLEHSGLPQLIYRFVTLPESAADEAQAILRLLSTVAATTVGATALDRLSILIHICQHPILNPPAAFSSDSGDSSIVFPSHLPSFSPYLARTAERDSWHSVWCCTVSLVYLLLHSLCVSGSSPSFLSESLQFLLVYRPRLHFVLQRRRQRSLSIGHLQEVEAVVRYLSLTGRLMAAGPSRSQQDELLG